MNKAELIAAIAEKSNLTKAQAEAALAATFETITEVMMGEEKKAAITGFGTFVVKKRAARQGRNPSTGLAITIPEAQVAGFKPAAQLKQTINNQGK